MQVAVEVEIGSPHVTRNASLSFLSMTRALLYKRIEGEGEMSE
jgi:hypothetical protein